MERFSSLVSGKKNFLSIFYNIGLSFVRFFSVIADLFLHIRNEMDAIYDLTGMISDLDILLSLAKVFGTFCNHSIIVDENFANRGKHKNYAWPDPYIRAKR